MLEVPAPGQPVARPPPSHPAGLPRNPFPREFTALYRDVELGVPAAPHSNAHSLGRLSANLSAQRGEHEGE